MCEPSHSSASPTPSSSQTTASPSDPLARPPTSNFTFGSPTKSARPVAPFPTSTSFDFLLPSTFSRTSPISFSPAVPAIESTREEGQEMNQGSKGEEQGTKGKVFEAEASEIASDMSSVVSTPSTSTSRPTLPTMPSSPPSQRTKPPSPFSFPSSSTPSIYTQALSVPYDKKDLLVDSYVDKVQKPLGGLVEIQHDDYLMSTTRQENEDLSRSPEELRIDYWEKHRRDEGKGVPAAGPIVESSVSRLAQATPPNPLFAPTPSTTTPSEKTPSRPVSPLKRSTPTPFSSATFSFTSPTKSNANSLVSSEPPSTSAVAGSSSISKSADIQTASPVPSTLKSFTFSLPTAEKTKPEKTASAQVKSAFSTELFTATSKPTTSLSGSSSSIFAPSSPSTSTPLFKSSPSLKPTQSLTSSPVAKHSSSSSTMFSSTNSFAPLYEEKRKSKLSTLDLLDDGGDVDAVSSHELITSPMFSHDVLATYDEVTQKRDFPQYGVFGRLIETCSKGLQPKPTDPRLFLNTNAPLSAVICGVQGSGKSHSVSILLESMLLQDPRVGSLKRPLSTAVFHFGESGASSQPCEAAFIANCSDPSVKVPPVVVYVSPASFKTMREVYSKKVPTATILPLYLSEKDLDSRSMLSMLGVTGNGEPPLYITIILNILSSLGENFTYSAFLRKLDERKATFNPAQLAGLEQRQTLLESFLEERAEPRGVRCQEARKASRNRKKFAVGQLTIFDLTDPFIEPSQACSLFEICLNHFIRFDVGGGGKVCLLDEAHKYLGDKGGGARLTNALLSTVRQQRHFGMRVIFSTQEPAVISPSLLALTSIIILHRFSSASWWSHLAKHAELDDDAFDKVVKLKTGQALVIAPAALGLLAPKPTSGYSYGGILTPLSQLGEDLAGLDMNSTSDSAATGDGVRDEDAKGGGVGQVGRGYMVVRGRKRLTSDGGASILAVV